MHFQEREDDFVVSVRERDEWKELLLAEAFSRVVGGRGGEMWKNVKIAPLLVQTYQSSTEVCPREWGTGMGRCKWFIIKGKIC